MKRAIVLLAGFAMAGTVSLAAGGSSVSGQYVEARTGEVFTGGCIMGSEAGTMGKPAGPAATDHAHMGQTDQNAFTGSALGTKWSDPNKRSAFFGTFSR